MKQPSEYSSESAPLFDLSEMARILVSYKKTILASVVIVTALVVTILFLMPETYRAQTTILIDSEGENMIPLENLYSRGAASEEYIMTQKEVLESRSIAEKVVRHLRGTGQLEMLPYKGERGFLGFGGAEIDISEPEDETQMAIDYIVENVKATPVIDTNLIRLYFYSENPFVAQLVANAIADTYIQSNMFARVEEAESATGWLGERLKVLLGNVQRSEEALQAYREENSLMDASGQRTLTEDETDQLNEKYVDAKNERAELETVVKQIETIRVNSPAQLVNFPSIMHHPLIQDLKESKIEAERTIAKLRQRYGPKHPKLIEALSDERAIDAEMANRAELIARSIEDQYSVAQFNEQSLMQQLQDSKRKVQGENRVEFKLKELEREVETNRQLYELFLSRFKEAEEAKSLQASEAKVLDRAFTPKYPVSPNKKMGTALAIFVSFIVAFILAWIYDMIKGRYLRIPQDVDRAGYRMLSFVPALKRSAGRQVAKAYITQRNSLFAESIRTIRTCIILDSVKKQNKVILVGSSIPGEGKSTIATNLAFSLSEMERVLLIEADMRRPFIGESLGIGKHTKGLSDILQHGASAESCIRKIKPAFGSNFDILVAGTATEKPLELLLSAGFKNMIEELAPQYDRILIDSAPSHAVSDVLLLSRHSDTLIYVARSDYSIRSVVDKGIRKVLETGIPLLGVVLNGFDVEKHSSNRQAEAMYNGYGYWSGSAKGNVKTVESQRA